MISSIPQVVAAQPLTGYNIFLKFDDGAEGVVDFGKHPSFRGVFEPTRDLDFFRQVRVHPEFKTIYWPNNADWDPVVLHALVTGRPIEFGQPPAVTDVAS
jgi:Protein of unknown function (DUF2442)